MSGEKHGEGVRTTSLDAELARDERLWQLTNNIDVVEAVQGAIETNARLEKAFDKHRPPLMVAYKEGALLVAIKVSIPVRKTVAITGSVLGAVWAISNFLTQNWPAVVDFINKVGQQAKPP